MIVFIVLIRDSDSERYSEHPSGGRINRFPSILFFLSINQLSLKLSSYGYGKLSASSFNKFTKRWTNRSVLYELQTMCVQFRYYCFVFSFSTCVKRNARHSYTYVLVHVLCALVKCRKVTVETHAGRITLFLERSTTIRWSPTSSCLLRFWYEYETQ